MADTDMGGRAGGGVGILTSVGDGDIELLLRRSVELSNFMAALISAALLVLKL